MRRAQRLHLSKAKRDADDPEEADPFAAVVCGNCGQLGWPDQRRDPHRDEAGAARTSVPPCTHCGEQSWIDLGQESTALALRRADEESVRPLAGGPLRIGYLASVGLVVGAMMGSLLAYEPWVAATCALLGGLVSGLWGVKQHLALRPASALLPTRWTMALPPADAPRREVVGTVTPSDRALLAPLTGRGCLAYEVGVRFDDDGDAPAATWALLEQHVGEFAIDGEAMPALDLHLEVPRQCLGLATSMSLEAAAQVYLRQRGFGAESGTMRLFESIVPMDARVRVALSDGGGILRTLAR